VQTSGAMAVCSIQASRANACSAYSLRIQRRVEPVGAEGEWRPVERSAAACLDALAEWQLASPGRQLRWAVKRYGRGLAEVQVVFVTLASQRESPTDVDGELLQRLQGTQEPSRVGLPPLRR